MKKLTQKEYPIIASLIENSHHQASIGAVLAGIVPGEIFAPNTDRPASVLIRTPQCLVVAGDATNTAFNRAIQTKIDFFDPVICDSNAWVEQLSNFHPNHFLKKYTRVHYQFETLKLINFKKQLPATLFLQPIDSQLIKQPGVNNICSITDWITTNWKTLANFEKNGLGMCVRSNTAIVSWSLLDCRIENKVELGVYTDPAYRRKGLGAITTAATVESCVANHFTDINWHTVATNIGARKIAKKVGFVHRANYAAYTPYPPIENHTDLSPSQWADQAAYYEKANLKQPRFNWIAAECWAKSENVERTIYHLEQMVQNGWRTTAEELSQLPLFQRFESAEAWQRFLATL